MTLAMKAANAAHDRTVPVADRPADEATSARPGPTAVPGIAALELRGVTKTLRQRRPQVRGAAGARPAHRTR